MTETKPAGRLARNTGPKAKKPPAGTPAAINLEQSEAMRQRALGAQDALRAELDNTKATLADREQRLTAESHRADGYRDRMNRAEKQVNDLNADLSCARGEATEHQLEATHLRGQLAMLERMGTIPKEEPQMAMDPALVLRYGAPAFNRNRID